MFFQVGIVEDFTSLGGIRVVRGKAQPVYDPSRFVPCGIGDAAVCDLETGLMWERKIGSPADGSLACGDPLALHHAGLICSQEEAMGPWIEAVNAETYAGYNDWRVPTIQELISILDYDVTRDTAALFGPSIGGAYRSSSRDFRDQPWYLRTGGPSFGGGNVKTDTRPLPPLFVRAVRGGR